MQKQSLVLQGGEGARSDHEKDPGLRPGSLLAAEAIAADLNFVLVAELELDDAAVSIGHADAGCQGVCVDRAGISQRGQLVRHLREVRRVHARLSIDGRFARSGDVRDRDSRDDGDNRDDNEKFDQAERRVELCFE